jgi:predicted NUDIX family NTP pyrophosphohydrolase
MVDVPEIDEVRFFEMAEARRAINIAQTELLDRLLSAVRRQPT